MAGEESILKSIIQQTSPKVSAFAPSNATQALAVQATQDPISYAFLLASRRDDQRARQEYLNSLQQTGQRFTSSLKDIAKNRSPFEGVPAGILEKIAQFIPPEAYQRFFNVDAATAEKMLGSLSDAQQLELLKSLANTASTGASGGINFNNSEPFQQTVERFVGGDVPFSENANQFRGKELGTATYVTNDGRVVRLPLSVNNAPKPTDTANLVANAKELQSRVQGAVSVRVIEQHGVPYYEIKLNNGRTIRIDASVANERFNLGKQ